MPKIALEYNVEEPDSIKGKTFRCPILKQSGKTLLNCLSCDHFPCDAIRPQDLSMLRQCSFVEQKNPQLIPKRKNMYILRKANDLLVIADDKFNPKSATEKDLKDIEEVYYVSKVYEKKVQLVLKNNRT